MVEGCVLLESWRLVVFLRGGLGICLSGWEGGPPWANTNWRQRVSKCELVVFCGAAAKTSLFSIRAAADFIAERELHPVGSMPGARPDPHLYHFPL
jgi:hypothetical protein